MSEAVSHENMPKEIGEAVGAIMAKVRNVEKQGENKFHNYKFARVEDLMFQVQPAMVEAGLVITQDEVRHEIVSDSLMLATYAFSLSHKSGVTWGPVHQTGMSNLKNTKGGYDDKALNKCHTAARKYFILGLFQVPAGDLPDADAEEDKPTTARPEAKRADPRPPTTAERADRLEATLKAAKPEDVEKAWGLASALLAMLSVEMPERLEELTKLYEFRRPNPAKEAA